MIAPSTPVWGSILKASLEQLICNAEEWYMDDWEVSWESNEAQMSAGNASEPQPSVGAELRKSPKWGLWGWLPGVSNINNPTADAHQAWLYLCPHRGQSAAEAAGDRRGLVSLSLKSPWDTGVRPPQPADREDESAPLKDVPQSSLTAETCLKVHGFLWPQLMEMCGLPREESVLFP